jgi:hypothetical protein
LQRGAHMTAVPEDVRSRVEFALASARAHGVSTDAEPVWERLADAHVLAQPYALWHTRTHAEMLRLAVRTRTRAEIVGQAIRLVLAGPGSLSGRYPAGNSGRSNVSMFEPMPERSATRIDDP